MITIIDYGMGNLRSVEKAVKLFSPEVRISSSCNDVLGSDKVILPGVGAFSNAMRELKKRGLESAIVDILRKKTVPFLGICLGFQLLFSESEEGGKIKGLGILKGRVRRFKETEGLKIPHIGWNRILIKRHNSQKTVLEGVEDGSYMYFVHSYYVEEEDSGIVICETEYRDVFTSGIHKDNVWAFQFHPEKSQACGLRIIKNFVDI